LLYWVMKEVLIGRRGVGNMLVAKAVEAEETYGQFNIRQTECPGYVEWMIRRLKGLSGVTSCIWEIGHKYYQ